MKDTAQLRVENKKKIRTVMREGKEFTKQELARHTGLSTATCNTLINEMAADGEVTGHKLQLGEVGRSSLAYQLNESYEFTLCVWFEMMDESRVLYLYLLNALGNIAEKRQASFSFLDEACLINEIEQMMQKQKRLRAIMIGTPSLLKEGKMENDMHYRVYGYYKKNCQPDQIPVFIY